MAILDEYIVAAVLGICLCVGYIIKHAVPTDYINRYIPLIMGVLGVVINVWLVGSVTPTTVLGGLISGLSSTGMHEALRQFITSR